jgi:hypothetical protein
MALWLATAAVEGILAGCSGSSQAPNVVTVDVAAPKESATAAVESPAGTGEVRHAQDAHLAKIFAAERHCCKGTNDCKGKGNCKNAHNDCKGRNDCKGIGGCKDVDCTENGESSVPPRALPIIPLPVGSAGKASCNGKGSCRATTQPGCCKGLNDCKGKGNCKVEKDHDCKGQNGCKGTGGCKPLTC